MLMTFALEALASAISPARSTTRIARDLPRQNDRVVARAHVDVFAGEQRVQLPLQPSDALIDDQVVPLALRGAPDDQAHRAGALAVDQNLAGLHDHGVGDRGIGHGDSRDVEIGRHHGRTASRQRHALDLAAPLGLLSASRRRAVAAGGRATPPAPAGPIAAPSSIRSLMHDLFAALRRADRLDRVDLRRRRRGGAPPAAGARRTLTAFTTGGGSGPSQTTPPSEHPHSRSVRCRADCAATA